MLPTTDGVRYFLTDHLGSVVGTVNDAGDLRNKYEYLPFGELLESQISDNNQFGFTGQEAETELSTEWTYHGARYYDTKFKIWTQVDALSSKYSDMTPYNYAANNPLRFTHPSGDSITVAGAPLVGPPTKEASQTLQGLSQIKSAGKEGNRLVTELQSNKFQNVIVPRENAIFKGEAITTAQPKSHSSP